MGLDFTQLCAPSFQRSWDKNRAELSQPSLFINCPELRDQSFRALARDGRVFALGQEYILKLDGEAIAVCDGMTVVGTIPQPPQHLIDAMEKGHGFAHGVIRKTLVEGIAADISVS